MDDDDQFDMREEPDGEETMNKNSQSSAQQSTSFNSTGTTSNRSNSNTIKVPNWILSDATLEVAFNERAASQIQEFHIDRVSDFLSTRMIEM